MRVMWFQFHEDSAILSGYVRISFSTILDIFFLLFHRRDYSPNLIQKYLISTKRNKNSWRNEDNFFNVSFRNFSRIENSNSLLSYQLSSIHPMQYLAKCYLLSYFNTEIQNISLTKYPFDAKELYTDKELLQGIIRRKERTQRRSI